MNIELEEVVQDVSDDALELAAGGAQGGDVTYLARYCHWINGYSLTGRVFNLGV